MVSKRKTIKNINKKFGKTRKQKGGMETTKNNTYINIGRRLVDSAGYDRTGPFFIAFRKALDNGVNLDYKDGNGLTALHRATAQGNKEIVSILLENGVNVDEKDNRGYTSLMKACWNGRVEILLMLLDKGANINVTNKYGETAIMKVIERGNMEIIPLLIDHGADIEQKNHNGDTALMYASKKGNAEVVSMLLDRGANINVTNNNGETAIMLASNNDIKSLIEAKQEQIINDVNLVTYKGETDDGEPLLNYNQGDIAQQITPYVAGKQKIRFKRKFKKYYNNMK